LRVARSASVTANSKSTLNFPSLHFNDNVDYTKKLRIGFTSRTTCAHCARSAWFRWDRAKQ